MGPGRKLYHKPCLSCLTCGKRLDSYSLVEHDEEPYCKTCHVKNFGTRDLRSANLPDRDDVLLSPPTSPTRVNTNLPPAFPARPSPAPSPAFKYTTGTNGNIQSPPLPVRRTLTGQIGTSGSPFDRSNAATPPATFLRPNRALSPIRGERNISPPTNVTGPAPQESEEDNHNPEQPGIVAAPAFDDGDVAEETAVTRPFTPTHTGRSGVGNLPRTVPLSPTKLAQAYSSPSKSTTSYTATPPLTHRSTSSTSSTASTGNYVYSSGPQTPISSNATGNVISGRMGVPLVPNATGTRYGAALGGKIGSPVVKTPTGGYGSYGGTPICSRCQKTVYFAEQVKAIGKTWHKACLRCMECSTTLDSSRLTEKEGDPFCHRCYGKLYGPQGSGYALLGKAGG
ncbi:hypothetical protein EUX98_g8402 [Antrodiella citrinella]|uniref:LIM zinc-binding domain-containing protein n=1 Tax=Antrodiella citrinella TaxID=2447956 RepID=A0A4S4M9P5_9APHY|nr:hypothetical protein EUX98_g8402 [Antrodiella citrinella]